MAFTEADLRTEIANAGLAWYTDPGIPNCGTTRIHLLPTGGNLIAATENQLAIQGWTLKGNEAAVSAADLAAALLDAVGPNQDDTALRAILT